MENSTQGNENIQGKGTEKYEKWTSEESNELLKLMVDAATRGWRDSNGLLNTFLDHEDLRIAVGSGTAVGTHSIALGDDTDARTSYTEERRVSDSLIEYFMYDPDTEAFIVTDKQDFISSEITQAIELIDTREPNCWNVIKEIPNLDDDDRFKVLDLLNTKAKKSEFLSMTPEERSKWITLKLN
ncbi:Hypothetical predicted protein [Olea europaea subsp. europaea]|uniref:At2g29880-like C-terminal domain-containing protein n=1 Tax=Olea europaea subsp. europaea TaxID=158383 RepID=A0A8S0S0K1_OLEEU|nr:Hypothetical predicted protein [Olea europaea subsp. europaea]